MWREAITLEVTSGEEDNELKIHINNLFRNFRNVASRLDSTWKNFAAGLDERSTVLSLSVLFHQKAENVKLSTSLYPRKHFLTISTIVFSTSRVWRAGQGTARLGRSATTSACWSRPSTPTRPCTRPCVRHTPRSVSRGAVTR